MFRAPKIWFLAILTTLYGLSSSAGVVLPVVIPNIEQNFVVYLTGYSSTPDTAQVSHPVVHRNAGGTGTFSDPITLAVGRNSQGGQDILDFPAGTRFYIRNLRKYAIVEDTCTAPTCHSGYQGAPWLDIYIGAKDTSQQCANSLRDFQTIIMTPRSGYPVIVGALGETGCKVFGR